ncbi:MAG TPA: RagB/SusD family nutrient uptake outer membrane protein [Ohtaekwangia sp.]|nr:RagB/SusD family nutrient uptake outer membrane protein [Ohtaekwangia sp.]
MNTKNIIAFLLVLLLTGCEDFLEKNPLDTVNTENFYKTADDAVAAINAAYQPLQRPKLHNMRMWTTDIIAGNSEVGANPVEANDGIETKDQANFITTTDNAGVLDLYQGPAPGILYANLVLQKVPAIDMDETLKNRILGEAKFLRAYYYFILVRFFGDVPLILTPQTPGDDLRPFRTPKEEVYAQIIKDLEEAIDQLPQREDYSAADIGRASKGAAAGMLAKVYLTLGEWEKTVALCSQVASLGYALNDDYAANFNPSTENSTESLFEVQYLNPVNNFWDDANQSSWTTNFMGPRDSPLTAVGWGWNQPTQEFVDAYEEGDRRKDVTIFYEGGPQFDGKDYKASMSYVTGYSVRKFVLPAVYVPTGSSGSPLNWPVLRYADVLLMKAEALNELGRTDEAEAPLNEVRERAGLDAIEGLDQNDFREAVLHERRMELAFEGHRWFDLIRVDNGEYGLAFLHSIGKTNASEKHLLFPIPQAERDVNPNLTQNPGY